MPALRRRTRFQGQGRPSPDEWLSETTVTLSAQGHVTKIAYILCITLFVSDVCLCTAQLYMFTTCALFSL
jgi:hypothetical protein